MEQNKRASSEQLLFAINYPSPANLSMQKLYVFFSLFKKAKQKKIIHVNGRAALWSSEYADYWPFSMMYSFFFCDASVAANGVHEKAPVECCRFETLEQGQLQAKVLCTICTSNRKNWVTHTSQRLYNFLPNSRKTEWSAHQTELLWHYIFIFIMTCFEPSRSSSYLWIWVAILNTRHSSSHFTWRTPAV